MIAVVKQLLIVEDDPGLQSQMRWCFSDDVEVSVASDRDSALAALRRLEPGAESPCDSQALDWAQWVC